MYALNWVFCPYRCENYAISMLEQCENLNEVELFMETKTSDGKQHKDANYILAILDARKKFVAHERFQYVLLKKFGESDQQVCKIVYTIIFLNIHFSTTIGVILDHILILIQCYQHIFSVSSIFVISKNVLRILCLIFLFIP